MIVLWCSYFRGWFFRAGGKCPGVFVLILYPVARSSRLQIVVSPCSASWQLRWNEDFTLTFMQMLDKRVHALSLNYFHATPAWLLLIRGFHLQSSRTVSVLLCNSVIPLLLADPDCIRKTFILFNRFRMA